MQIGFKNINKIIEGTVVLDGLTVLAGVNDTGKSTVGKTLFALIKSISNGKRHNNDNYRNRETLRLITFLYSKLSRLGVDNISIGLPPSPREFSEMFSQDIEVLELLSYVQNNIESLDITPSNKSNILSTIENIRNRIEERTKPLKAFRNELNSSIEAEFLNNICRKGSDISEITFKEQDTQDNLHVILQNNKVVKTSMFNVTDFTIEDATFVESPLYIHMIDTLRSSSTLNERSERVLHYRPYVNYHVKDMAEKLNSLRYRFDENSLFDNDQFGVNSFNINKIIGGRFMFDAQSKKLYWKKDGLKYSPENVASGIKSFGVIQMLLETYSIDNNKILILDEPENHLHPEWQIKFAGLLVDMATKGIPILISSHSPYFIQAIRYFSNGTPFDKYVRYYLIDEKTKDGSVIEDVSTDLNKVFQKLTAPMNKIINLGR